MTGLQLDEAAPPPGAGRRQSDLDGAPWPVKAVATLGVTTVIALYFAWLLGEDVRGGQKDLNDKLNVHLAHSVDISKIVSAMETEHQRSNRMIQRVLRQMCRQQAKNRDDLDGCDPIE